MGALGALSRTWEPLPGYHGAVWDQGHDGPIPASGHWPFEETAYLSRQVPNYQGVLMQHEPNPAPTSPTSDPSLTPHPTSSQSLPEGPGFEPREVTSH